MTGTSPGFVPYIPPARSAPVDFTYFATDLTGGLDQGGATGPLANAFAAAIAAGHGRVFIPPTAKVRINAPVWLSSTVLNLVYELFSDGMYTGTLLLDDNLGTTTGSANPTYAFYGNQTSGSTNVTTTSAVLGAMSVPSRVYIHDLQVMGNTPITCAGLYFGNNASATFERISGTNMYHGMRWLQYVDMPKARDCIWTSSRVYIGNGSEGSNLTTNIPYFSGTGSLGGTPGFLVYQDQYADGLIISGCKGGSSNWLYYTNGGNNGGHVIAPVGGRFVIVSTHGLEITGDHFDGGQDTQPYAAFYIQDSTVAFRGGFTHDSATPGQYFCYINDSQSHDVSHVIFDGVHFSHRFDNYTTARIQEVWIAAAHLSTVVSFRNSPARKIRNGQSTNDFSGLWVGSTDSGVATALAANAGLMATGNFDLRNINGTWVLVPAAPVMSIRSHPKLSSPTFTSVSNDGTQSSSGSLASSLTGGAFDTYKYQVAFATDFGTRTELGPTTARTVTPAGRQVTDASFTMGLFTITSVQAMWDPTLDSNALISSTAFPSGTTVSSISGNVATVSNSATSSGTNQTLTIARAPVSRSNPVTATLTNGSSVITLTSGTFDYSSSRPSLDFGALVTEATNFPTGTIITAVTSTTTGTVSAPYLGTTGSGKSVTITRQYALNSQNVLNLTAGVPGSRCRIWRTHGSSPADPSTDPVGCEFVELPIAGENFRVFDQGVYCDQMPWTPHGASSYVTPPPTGSTNNTTSEGIQLLAGTLVPTRMSVISGITSAYTASHGDIVMANPAGGPFTVTLPTLVAGGTVTVKNNSSSTNVITVTPASGMIDGAGTATITGAWAVKTFVTDGTTWVTV